MVLIDLEGRPREAEVLFRQIRDLNVLVPLVFVSDEEGLSQCVKLASDPNVNMMHQNDVTEGVMKFMIRGLRQIRKAADARIYAQTELAESEYLLKQSQQLAKLGHFKFNFISKKNIWSEETFRIYGLDPAKDLPSDDLFFGLIHPEDYDFFMQETSRLLALGEPYHLQYRLKLKDGTVKFIENYTRPYYDVHGHLETCTGSVQDITAKKETEQELKETQNRLFRILENLPSGAVFVEKGKITLNRAAERITGYNRSELQTLDDWFQKLYGKNHEVVKMIYENDRNKNFPSSQITPLTRKDGKQVDMEFAGVELGGTEVWLLNDLSDLKSQQELFKGLFEHSSDGMLLVEGMKIVDCNQQAVKLLKAKNKNHIVGKEPIDLCYETQPNGQSLSSKRTEVNDMLAGSNTVVTEWNHKTFEGAKLPLRVTITKINIRNKAYRLLVWHDLSEQYELKRKEENKDRFIKKLVSYQHDLITILDVDTLSFIYTNDQASALLGYSNYELIQMGGTFWTNMVDPEDLSQVKEMVEAFPNLKNEEALQVFVRAKHKNGSTVFLHIKFTVFSLDISGQTNQVIGSARAIPRELFNAHQQVSKGQKLSTVLESLPDAVFVYDLENRKNIFMNKQLAYLLGSSPVDFKQYADRSFKEFIFVDDLKEVEKHLSTIEELKEGQAADLTFRLIRVDGKTTEVQVRYMVYKKDINAKPMHILGVVRELTDSTTKLNLIMPVEGEVNAYHEDSFKAFFDSSPDAIFLSDYEGTVLAVNPTACNLQKMDRYELLGKNMLEIMPKGLRNQVSEGFHRMVSGATEAPVSFIWQEGGKALSLEIRACPIDLKKKPSILLHVRDLSNQTRVDQHGKILQELMEESSDLAIMISSEGEIIYTNQTFQKTIGEITFSELLINANSEYSKQKSRGAEILNKALEAGKWNGEIDIDGRNGKKTRCSLSVIAHTDEKSKLLFFSAILKEISGLNLKNEAIPKTNDTAEDLDSEKALFLASMSHEIRTPINGMVGLTEVLLKSNLNEGQYELLKAIRTSGDTLTVLLNDMLDLSKIMAGKMEIEKQKFNLKELLSAVVKSYESMANSKNVALNFAVDSKIPTNLIGDNAKLSRVLHNLVGNAVKYTDTGRIEVLVTKGIEKSEGLNLTFLVKDTGIGIPESEIPEIFDSFNWSGKPTNRRFGGRGLSLSVTQKLVELQGGSIQVESKEGKGSAFSFNLQFIYEKMDIAAQAAPAHQESNEPQYTFKKARVLIAEDNSVNQLLMKRVLEKLNLEADLAENGTLVLQMVGEKEYDLVLMDMQMPEIDGYMATERIRNDKSQTKSAMPIIAITANSSIEDATKCFKAGANDYISKPFKQGELIEKLSKFLVHEKL